MLNIMIVVGMICLVVIGSMGIALKMYRRKIARERLEYRRQRDLARQIRLQRKIDEFNAFKRSIGYTEEDEIEYERKLEEEKRQKLEEDRENYKNAKCDHEYCNEDCMECREFYYQRYLKCQNARKYYDSKPVLRNIRVTLQDYNVQEVLVLYKEFVS